MLKLNFMLCDFNKSEHVIKDELNNIDIIKNTCKTSQIIDNRYLHLNMILDKIKNDSLGKNLLTEFSEGSFWLHS